MMLITFLNIVTKLRFFKKNRGHKFFEINLPLNKNEQKKIFIHYCIYLFHIF